MQVIVHAVQRTKPAVSPAIMGHQMPQPVADVKNARITSIPMAPFGRLHPQPVQPTKNNVPLRALVMPQGAAISIPHAPGKMINMPFGRAIGTRKMFVQMVNTKRYPG